LIQKLRDEAQRINGPAVVLSFDPHPLQLLAPDRFQPVLTDSETRAELLKQAGADQVVLLQTTKEILNLSPVEFFQRILLDGCQLKSLVEGFNFRFGHDRTGDVDLLKSLCEANQLTFTLVPPFQLDNSPVSSSRVRNALVEGNVRAAERLLGRSYAIRGFVGTGQRRGRHIGFPTANLEQVETLLPGDGVYAVRVEFDGLKFSGAANIGSNPTFAEHARKIEVHLLDFSGDLYGRKLRVTFHDRIRGVRKFAGVDQLVEQLQKDVAQIRSLLSS
jgi:riboflavin kinase/FMN adenylyltransferase